MSSIISKSNFKKIESLRKYILKGGIWALIGGVALGAIMILVGSDESIANVIGKLMGTIFIVALMMMISVNNFRRLVSEDAAVSIFALVGLVSNMAWAILWILLCWNPEWFVERYPRSSCSFCDDIYYTTSISVIAKFAIVSSLLSALGFIGSNVLSIYEGDKRGTIRPLKITVTVCSTYEMVYFAIMTLSGFKWSSEFDKRLLMLAGFAGFVWWILLIATLIISFGERARKGRKKIVENAEKAKKYDESMKNGITDSDSASTVASDQKVVKTDDELRAEIEEKVRREMIEKEVRKKLEAEKENKVPPMSDDE